MLVENELTQMSEQKNREDYLLLKKVIKLFR